MKIAIDVLALLSPESKHRGIGVYTLNMLKKLFERDTVNEYYLVNMYEKTDLKKLLNYGENVIEVYFETAIHSKLKENKHFYKYVIGNIISNFVLEYKIDYYYLTSSFDSFFEYEAQWFSPANLVGTIYDLIPLVLDKIYLKDKSIRNFYNNRIKFIKSFKHFFAISDSVKTDLMHYLKIPENKITSIYSGIDNIYKTKDYSKIETLSIRSKYDIDDEYIMMTGGDDERKNIAGLIQAYSQMQKKLIAKYQLVIVCKISSYSKDRYAQLCSSLDVKNRVIFTGFVPYDDLVFLYNNAEMMAFPSLYEGFGLPIVEAMACGTLVLTSNTSSLKEIAEHGSIIVDPSNIQDISKGLEYGLNLPKYSKKEMIEKGYEISNKYTWDNSITLFLDKISSFENNESEYLKIPIKHKIAWFTPLPPIESGISDYNVDIINSLLDIIDIDVYVDDYKHNAKFIKDMNVFYHKDYLKYKSEYMDTIYHIGNNMYHAYMLPYLNQFKGTVVLHDYNLSGLVLNLTFNKGNEKEFINILSEDHDRDLVQTYTQNLKAQKTSLKEQEFECNTFITKKATKIIVHNIYAQEKLLNKNLNLQVFHVPIYSKEMSNTSRIEARVKLGIDENILMFSVLGYAQGAKRILQALSAFITLELDNNQKFYIIGKIENTLKTQINTLIKKNNAADKVYLKGLVSDIEFDQYITASDICLNLRYPYYGESSASLMRILSVGRSCLVTNIGGFREFPDDVVVKLPAPEGPEAFNEIDTLKKVFTKLALNKELRFELEHKSLEFIRQYNIKSIANLYKDILYSTPKDIKDYDKIMKELIEAIADCAIDDSEVLYGLAKTLAYVKNTQDYNTYKSIGEAVSDFSSLELMNLIKKNINKRNTH